jgi:repressor LexA
MSFGNRLKTARGKKGLSRKDLADVLKLSYSTVAKYETDQRFPDAKTLNAIAALFNVSTDWLLEREPLHQFPERIAEGQTIYVPSTKAVRAAPVFRAGDPGAPGSQEGYPPVAGRRPGSSEYFYLIAPDDSMREARIEAGDLVLVREQDQVVEGDIAVVLLVGTGVFIRRLFKAGDLVVLQSHHPQGEYPPLVLLAEKAKVLGKVIEIKIVLEPVK